MTASVSQLDRSLARGIAWTGAVKWVTSLVTWGITLIVARLLMPEDYGLFGMAMVFVGLAQLLSDVGLGAAIIQARHLPEALAARLGGLAIMISTAIAVLSIGAANLLALFFREPAVRWLITALAATFVLRGVQVLRRAMLTRGLRFRQLAWVDGAETIVTSLSTLAYALLGLRYWSLVGGVLTGALVSTAMLVTLYPHRIQFPRRTSELDGTLRFGAMVLGGQLAWYAYSTADMVVVGRMLGSTALGAYTFAWVLASIALERIAVLLGRVTPAIFSAVQHDRVALRRYVLKLTEGLALITTPICVGIALVADLIVRVALGDAWLAVIAPMRLLAVYAAIRCVSVILPQVLVYTGRARQSMKYNLIALVVLVPLFVTGATLSGTTGVALAWVIALPVLTASTYLRYLRRFIGLSFASYARALRPAAGATAGMVAAVLLARLLLEGRMDGLALLVSLVVTGAVSYGIIVFALHRRRLHEVLRLLRASDATGPVGTIDGSSTTATVPPRGRILLISYHFAPDPAIGSLRWQKFARLAAERGWGLDVIMRDETSIGSPDPDRIADLPPDVRRIGVPERPFLFESIENRLARIYRRIIPRPQTAQSLSASHVGKPRHWRDILRAYFSLVDQSSQRRWAREATRAALRIVDTDVHRVVIGCGPPYSACIAGRMVSKATGLPLITDLRDPWSVTERLPEHIASPVALAMNRWQERRTVAASALVVANTSPVGDAMRRLYPTTRIIDVPNGYDDDPLPPQGRRERFVIAYAGTIYYNRDPRTLLRALAMVVRALRLTPEQIGLDFMGDVAQADGVPMPVIAEEEGVGAYLRIRPTRPRRECLSFLSEASMLVLIPQDAEMVIPGKLYEYMRFEAWILALASPDGAVACLLNGSAASVTPPGDPTAIAEVIARRYHQHLAGERGVPIAIDERFSRRARAAAFFGAMDTVLRPSMGGQSPSAPEATPEWSATLTADLEPVGADRRR